MHHKRKRHPAARAGCGMCKPQKKGWRNPDREVQHTGFGKIRRLQSANDDLKYERYW